jgi:hypothetical protein
MNTKEFTARNASKYVVSAVVKLKVSRFTKDALTDYTSLEEDDNVVDIAGFLVGWYVSDKLRPITDTAVDKTADFVSAKRDAWKAKKDQATPAEEK